MRLRNRKPYHIFGATISWLAVVIQYFLMIEKSEVSVGETTMRFFSFFTILTNTLVACYFTLLLSNDAPNLKRNIEKPGVITAVAVYIAIVGLVYQFVLRYTWEPEGLQMIIDEFLHSIIPLYFVLYWFLFEEKLQVKWTLIPLMLIYPALYVVYILLCGMYSGFYPYPFVNVTVLGMDQVLINGFSLLCVFLIVIVIFIGLGKIIERSE
jgi:hypothetical protein